jgi:hypothetical protein
MASSAHAQISSALLASIHIPDGQSMRGRWYERHPVFVRAFEVFRDLPTTIQKKIAGHILRFRRPEFFDYQTNDANLKELGHDRIVGLLRAQFKRRWYDNDPVLHRALNSLQLMRAEYQVDFTQKILITDFVVTQYNKMQLAHRYQRDPGALERIIDRIFERHTVENPEGIRCLVEEVVGLITNVPEPVTKNIRVQVTGSDFKIRPE